MNLNIMNSRLYSEDSIVEGDVESNAHHGSAHRRLSWSWQLMRRAGTSLGGPMKGGKPMTDSEAHGEFCWSTIVVVLKQLILELQLGQSLLTTREPFSLGGEIMCFTFG